MLFARRVFLRAPFPRTAHHHQQNQQRLGGAMLLATTSMFAALAYSSQTQTEAQPISRKRAENNFIADAVQISLPSLVHIANLHQTFLGEMGTLGAGFVLDKEGFVCTNAHVVKSSGENLTVTLANGKEYPAQVWAVDVPSDLALVRVAVDNAEELVPITRGESKDLRIGEWVLALGSPFNLQNSVTAGIVSAVARKGRELGMDSHSTNFIQTDCSINSGNSGGPLVNLDGQVVGINTMKSGLGEGIAFSIPMDFAYPLLEELKANKRVVRPFAGCRVVSITPELVKRSRSKIVAKFIQDNPGLEEKGGVLVVQVQPHSPCEQAGFLVGDVIQRVNDDVVVHDASDLFAALKVGQTVKVEVRRGGVSKVLKLTPEPLLAKHVIAANA